jgi:hypothetical protein
MGGVMFDWLRRSRMGQAESSPKTSNIKFTFQFIHKLNTQTYGYRGPEIRGIRCSVLNDTPELEKTC